MVCSTARTVFDNTSTPPHFVVVNCPDAMMSAFYYPAFMRNLIFCSYELLCRRIEFIFLQYPNLECW